MIIIHYTGMHTAKAALKRLCDPKAEVSAHYLIDEKGKVYDLVQDSKRAWHAGVSHWQGETDINSMSIGIELANPGHEFGYRAFPEAQIGALAFLCTELMGEYDIRPSRILGHSDVAISRKIDPGHLFPWERLAEKGIGLWPAPGALEFSLARELCYAPEIFHQRLVEYGYNPKAPMAEVITAFHRHYCPERFVSCEDTAPIANEETCAKLLALLRQDNE